MSQTPGGPGWVQGGDGRWYPPSAPQGGPPPGGTYGQAPPGQGSYGQAPYGQPSYGHAPYGQAPYGQAPYGQAPYGQAPYGQAPYGQPPYDRPPYDQPPYDQPPYGQPPYGSGPYGQPGVGRGPYGQPGYGAHPPPGFPPAGGPRRSGGKGKVVAIVVGVVVVVVVLGGLALSSLVSSVGGAVAGGSGPGCDTVAAADVNAALGGTYELVRLGGVAGGVAGGALDNRVLADAEVSCWAVEAGNSDTGGRLARIARHAGADAAQRFVDERTRAMGSTEDRGGGISVSTDGYFNKDVRAGDEAFCTSGDFLGSAGVLVRRGNVLVYVSTTAAGQGSATAPDIQFPTSPSSPDAGVTFGTDDANCDLAVALAAKVS